MNSLSLKDVERRARELPIEDQLQLIEHLAHNIPSASRAADRVWDDELTALSVDPQIRSEIDRIGEEFSATEADGLERV